MSLKKILSSVLAAAMVLSTMSFSVLANNTVSTWDGTAVDRSWYDADPTATSYTITTAAQFAGLAEICNTFPSNTSAYPFKGQTIYLDVDIDLDGHKFAPIGDASADKRYFYGSFDGQGHTVSNIYIESSSAKFTGLFGKTGTSDYSQSFKDVTLDNVTIAASGTQQVGGLIGRADCSVVSGVNVTGKINISGYSFVGGIIGHSKAQISDCNVNASGTISANNWQAGGVVGAHYASSDASISNCSVNGDAENGGISISAYNGAIGGVVGYVAEDGVATTTLDKLSASNITMTNTTGYEGNGYIHSGAHVSTNSTYKNVTSEINGEAVEPDDADAVAAIVAEVNGTNYKTLQEAIKNANGNEINVFTDVTLDKMNYKDVTINLNGNKLTLANETVTSFNADKFYANNVVFKNGELDLAGEVMLNTKNVTLNDIDVDIVRNATVPFYVNKDSVLRIENGSSISISGTAASAFSGDGYQTAKIEVDNSSVEIDGTQKAYHAGAVVLTNGATFDVSNISGSALNSVDITVEDSSLTVSNVSYHGITNSVLTVDNGTVEVDGCGYYGLNLYEGSSIADNSTVTVSDSGTTNGCSVKLNGSLTVSDSVFTAETIMNPAYINADEDSTVVVKANQIKVEFIETEESKTAEGYKIYDINLIGVDNTTINRLTSADLTFENNSVLAADSTKKIPYTISVDGLATADGMSVEKTADNRYMFNFDGVTQPDETAAEITIGQVRFDGYGSLDFKVNATAVDEAGNASNVVNATKTADSIVELFVIGGGTADNIGELLVNENAGEFGVIDDTEIAVPSRNLTINVTFPNAVDANVAAYQDMQVVISGGDITPATADTFKYALGEDMTTDGKYVVNAELTKGRTYTVTVSGAGYRTFAYDVTMDNAKDTVKELTFWNNVMDTPKVVEKDNDDSTETVTFLAGDIVKDDNINIYDLSAVVSYFATPTDTNTADDNRQYDLNRDGMIDSKDVAYVLVSWGK